MKLQWIELPLFRGWVKLTPNKGVKCKIQSALNAIFPILKWVKNGESFRWQKQKNI